jgi:tetratricopeptide (TPR) repeat protein
MKSQAAKKQPTIQTARALLDEGKNLQAIWILEELCTKDPDNIRYAYLLAFACFRNEQDSDCETRLKSILLSNPEHAESLRLLSRLYLRQKKPASAIPVLKQYIRIQPGDPSTLEDLFHCHSQSKDYEKAYACYFNLTPEFVEPETVREFIKIAFCLKKYSSLTQAFRRSKSTDPSIIDDYHTKTYYALALLSLNENKEADSVFSELKSTFQPEEDCLKSWKLIFDITGSASHEEFLLEAMMRTYPDSVKARVQYLKYHAEKSPEYCLKELEELPNHPEYKKIQARALKNLQRYAEALEVLESLQLSHPEDESVPFEIGLNYFHQKRFQKALKYFEIYEKKQHSPRHYHYYLAVCHYYCERVTVAFRHLYTVLEESPICADAWHFFLDLLMEGNETEHSALFVSKAESVLSGNHMGLLKLARYYSLTDEQKAASTYENVLKLYPQCEESHRFLALHALHNHHFAAAFYHFQSIETKLDEASLAQYCQAAEKSLNYSTAFHLYLKLLQKQNSEHLKIQLKALLAKKSSFQEIDSRWNTEDLSAYHSVLKEYPMFWYKSGLRAYQQGNLEKALQRLSFLERHHQGFLRVRHFLGWIHVSLKKLDLAVEWFEKDLKKERKNPWPTRKILAELYFETDRLKEAKTLFVQLFQAEIEPLLTLEFLYQIYRAEQKLKNFIHLVVHSGKSWVKYSRIRILLANSYYENREFKKALNQYESLPENSPYFANGVFMAGLCLARMEKYEKAANVLQNFPAEENYPEGYHAELGVILMELGRFHSARVHLETSLELQQQVQFCHEHLCRLCLKTGDHESALVSFHKSSETTINKELLLSVTAAFETAQDYPLIAELLTRYFHRLVHQADNDHLLKLMVLSLYHCSRWEEALQYSQTIVESRDGFLMQTAKLYQKPDDFYILLLKAGEALEKNKQWFRMQLGHFYFERCNHEKAEQYYKMVSRQLHHFSSDPKELLRYYKASSSILFSRGNLHACFDYLNKGLELDPSNINLLEKLSYICGKLENYEKQAEVDQKLFTLNNSHPHVSLRLAAWFEKNQDIQNTIIHLKQYLKQNPHEHRILDKLAVLSKEAGMFGQEISAYEAMESSGKDLSREHFLNKGQAYLHMKKELKAAECFQAYLADHPDNNGLRFKLAEIYKNAGYLKRSRMTLLEIQQSEPNHPTVLFELARTYFEENRIADAQKYAQLLLNIRPFHEEASFLMAKICMQRNQNKEAIRYVDQALKAHPDNEEALCLLARLFKEENLLEDAREQYQKLYLREKNADYLLELALLNMKLKQKDTAIKQLKSIVEDSSKENGKLAKMARNFLRAATGPALPAAKGLGKMEKLKTA